MIAIATSSLAYATAEPVVLATFDGSKTAHSWQVMNDPVMGGRSTSALTVSDGVATFAGTSPDPDPDPKRDRFPNSQPQP